MQIRTTASFSRPVVTHTHWRATTASPAAVALPSHENRPTRCPRDSHSPLPIAAHAGGRSLQPIYRHVDPRHSLFPAATSAPAGDHLEQHMHSHRTRGAFASRSFAAKARTELRADHERLLLGQNRNRLFRSGSPVDFADAVAGECTHGLLWPLARRVFRLDHLLRASPAASSRPFYRRAAWVDQLRSARGEHAREESRPEEKATRKWPSGLTRGCVWRVVT
jgi:hypothetical protein